MPPISPVSRAAAQRLFAHARESTDGGAPDLQMLDTKKVQEIIAAVNQATTTKETTRRIVNAILVAAKIAADQFIK